MNLGDLLNLRAQKLVARIHLQGLQVSVEHSRGSTRTGVSKDGTEWSTPMKAHYGYIRKTEGSDDEHVDCYVGNSLDSDKVFVIDQKNPGKDAFDEQKIMLGFDSVEEAKKMYLAHMPSEDFFGGIEEMTVADFKKEYLV